MSGKLTNVAWKCPPHYFIVDSENVGRCKYCPEVRDYMQLLRRAGVYVLAGRRGAKAMKETSGKKREVLL